MNRNSIHKGGFFESKGTDIASSVQQDTIPTQLRRDTINEANEGIDPLFLMIERKTQEVEAIKEEVSTIRRQLAKRTEPKQDTTCHICPQSEPLPLFSIFESNSLPNNNFNLRPLYNLDFYLSNYSSSKPVFIETNDSKGNLNDLLIKSKPLPTGNYSIDWIFFPLIALVLTLGFLKIVFPGQITTIIRSTFFFFLANKLTKESSFHWGRFFIVLDLIYLTSVPLLTVLLISYFDVDIEINITLIALLTAIGLLAYKFYRYIFLKALALLTGQTSDFETLRSNQLLYSRVIGVVLIPLLLVFAYSTEILQTVTLYIITLSLSLLLVFSLIRTFQVFIFKGFSIFYLILYLCALEIIPILVIIKEFFRE